MADDLIVIHPTLKRRVSKSGKAKFTVEVKSEPLIFDLDPKNLEPGIAQAIAQELRERVEGITAEAAPGTLKARENERKAYAAGKPWAVKRFSGGKMGPTPPTTSTRAFNNSGRFAQSIVAGAAAGGRWIVNFAANRLDPSTGNVERIWNRLIQLVPAFANIGLLYNSPKFVETMRLGIQSMIVKGPMTADEFTAARAKALADAKIKNYLALIARAILAAA